ncbi:hypothetical protein JRQ81_001854, partial [Phrynocephalus forsythii]
MEKDVTAVPCGKGSKKGGWPEGATAITCSDVRQYTEHTTKSIIYSQALQYNHICSDPQDRDSKLKNLQNAFLRLQYPPHVIKEQINKARHIPRDNLLQDRSKGSNDRTPLVVTYSPQ